MWRGGSNSFKSFTAGVVLGDGAVREEEGGVGRGHELELRHGWLERYLGISTVW